MIRAGRRHKSSLALGLSVLTCALLYLWTLPYHQIPPADAQGVGIFSRVACTSITSPVAGQTFCFDQTANILKYWTGTTWVQAVIGQTGWVNVKDFGAVGDGATDDSPALAAALRAATASATNALVLLPPTSTSYRLNSPIASVGVLALVDFVFLGSGDFSGAGAPGTANKIQFVPSTGGTAAFYVQNNSNTDAILGVANGTGGVAVRGLVNSGNGIGVLGSSVSTTQPAVVGVSSGYYAGLFDNITDAGSDLANANNIGLVGQSVYSNAGYMQQGAVSGSGSTLGRNNIYPGFYVTRVTGSLGGFNFTAPLLRVDDTTASNGTQMDMKKQTVTHFIVDARGRMAIAATATGANTPSYTLDVRGETGVAAVFRGNPGGASNNMQLRLWGKNDAAELWALQIDGASTGTRTFEITNLTTGNTALTAGFTDGVYIGNPTGTDKGLGTLNFASATFANGRGVIIASTASANLTNILGLSATESKANNLRGTCNFAAAATCQVTFTNNEPDSHYFIAGLGCAAANAASVHPVGWANKTRAGFTLQASVANSNSCDWFLLR